MSADVTPLQPGMNGSLTFRFDLLPGHGMLPLREVLADVLRSRGAHRRWDDFPEVRSWACGEPVRIGRGVYAVNVRHTRPVIPSRVAAYRQFAQQVADALASRRIDGVHCVSVVAIFALPEYQGVARA